MYAANPLDCSCSSAAFPQFSVYTQKDRHVLPQSLGRNYRVSSYCGTKLFPLPKTMNLPCLAVAPSYTTPKPEVMELYLGSTKLFETSLMHCIAVQYFLKWHVTVATLVHMHYLLNGNSVEGMTARYNTFVV